MKVLLRGLLLFLVLFLGLKLAGYFFVKLIGLALYAACFAFVAYLIYALLKRA